MPCSGPNCPAAEERGEQEFNRVIAEIEKKHNFPTGEQLQDPKEAAFYHMYKESREKLRLAFRDLFLAEACDTW